MKIDRAHLILIAALVAVVAILVLSRNGCNRRGIEVDHKYVYDSIERVVKSKLPPPDTIKVKGATVIKWLPSAVVVDTIKVKGETRYVYNDAPIDTAAILSHYLTEAITYIDTIRDSALQAVISDIIFRNQIRERKFSYKILRPIELVDKRDRFQLIASLQFGAGANYSNQLNGVYGGADIGLKFKSGAFFSIGYMAGSGHFATVRAGKVIRLRKR